MIHFGYFLRAKRVARGWTIRKFSAETKVTEPRLIAYEKQPTPVMYDSTFGRLALALEMSPEELDQAWRVTEVEAPVERAPRASRTVRFELDVETHAWLADFGKALVPPLPPGEAAKRLTLKGLAEARAAEGRRLAVDHPDAGDGASAATAEGSRVDPTPTPETPGPAATSRLPPGRSGSRTAGRAREPKRKAEPKHRRAG